MSDIFSAGVNAVRSLTLTNVLLFGLILLFLSPAYLGYRIINDDKLMTQISSSFEELRYGIGDCLVYRAQLRGEGNEFIVRYTMRHDKYGMWYLAVRSQSEPTRSEATKKCELMAYAVATARKATGGNLFPGEIGHD